MMDTLIAEMPSQLREAIKEAKSLSLQPRSEIKQIVITGMGGSGIGADFVNSFVKATCRVPIIVNKSYSFPAFAQEGTLAIFSSYSGNTEETIEAFHTALDRGLKPIVVASGGYLKEKALELGLDFVQLAPNNPSPRAALGGSIVMQLAVLIQLGLAENKLLDELDAAANRIENEMADIQSKAERLAQMIENKTPIIYTTDRSEPVGTRLRQQINENSKMLCWHHSIPEMNHNELVGWRDNRNDVVVLFFRHRDDKFRNQVRIELTKEITGKLASVVELFSRGDSFIEKTFYHIHLGDWLSWYLSQQRNMDAVEVDVINYLKGELKKAPQA